MSNLLEGIGVVTVLLAVFFMGAWFHENDLARNFNETGDAKAWFNDIKCEQALKEVE